jgi:hypothetical protein
MSFAVPNAAALAVIAQVCSAGGGSSTSSSSSKGSSSADNRLATSLHQSNYMLSFDNYDCSRFLVLRHTVDPSMFCSD